MIRDGIVIFTNTYFVLFWPIMLISDFFPC